MQLVRLVQEILDNKCLTRELEEKVNQVLWSKQLDQLELAALEQLTQALYNRSVHWEN